MVQPVGSSNSGAADSNGGELWLGHARDGQVRVVDAESGCAARSHGWWRVCYALEEFKNVYLTYTDLLCTHDGFLWGQLCSTSIMLFIYKNAARPQPTHA